MCMQTIVMRYVKQNKLNIRAKLSAAVLLFVYAGFLYLTAAGSETQVKKAHSVMFKAVVGLIVALLAWLIVQFILTGLGVNPGYSLLGS